MIPIISNSGASNPQDRWGGPTARLCRLNNWSRFSLEQIAQFQKDTSGYSTIYVVRSDWLHGFTYNDCTEELHFQVKNTSYMFAEAGIHGGIMMVKVVIDQIFFMSNDVVTQLNNVLDNFPHNGSITI